MCLLPNMVISAARRTLWPHDFQIIQARPARYIALHCCLWRFPNLPMQGGHSLVTLRAMNPRQVRSCTRLRTQG